MSVPKPSALDSSADFPAVVARLQDEIAQLKQKVAQLDRLAHEDALVGLPNRRGFMRNLDRLIERVRRYGDSAALLFIDLDGLKMINDTYGHSAGDQALMQVAERLVQGVRASDCVARIGGDEFGVLLEYADEASARETAARLVATVAGREFIHDGEVLPLSVAIGVSIIAEADRAKDVIARADAEMYEAKSA
ncbi:MAG: GGDEF domain-containing protein [Sphingomicrobium sp.]